MPSREHSRILAALRAGAAPRDQQSLADSRRTFESIGRALPGRQNIVVTRNPRFRAEGCETVPSLRDALKSAVGAEVMVIGGGQLYREALPLATRMVLTFVDCAPEADTWFPRWDPEEWLETGRRHYPADPANTFGFDVVDYVRR